MTASASAIISVDDLGGGLDLAHHRGALSGHERAHLDVALTHGERELAGAERLDLLGLVLAVELLDLARELVLEHAHRMAGRAAGHDRVAVLGLEDLRLDVGVDRALLGAHEARADLHALGAERERRGHPAAVGDAAGGDDRDRRPRRRAAA